MDADGVEIKDSNVSSSSSSSSFSDSSYPNVMIFTANISDRNFTNIPGTILQSTVSHDVIHQLASVTDDRGLISPANFLNAITNNFMDKEATRDVKALGVGLIGRIINIFGKPYKGFLDFCESSGAMIEMSGGTIDHRASLAFQLYDYELDGVISKHELRLYLHSVYTLAMCIFPKLEEKFSVETLVDVASEIALKESDDPRVISISAFKTFYGNGMLNFSEKDLELANLLKIEEECTFMMKQSNSTSRGRTLDRRRGGGRDRSRSRSRDRDDDSMEFDEGTGVSSLAHRALFYALKGLDSPSNSRKRIHHTVKSVTESLESMCISKAISASRK